MMDQIQGNFSTLDALALASRSYPGDTGVLEQCKGERSLESWEDVGRVAETTGSGNVVSVKNSSRQCINRTGNFGRAVQSRTP